MFVQAHRYEPAAGTKTAREVIPGDGGLTASNGQTDLYQATG